MLWTVIGSVLMAGGFAVRIKVHSDPTSIPIYAISNLVCQPHSYIQTTSIDI